MRVYYHSRDFFYIVPYPWVPSHKILVTSPFRRVLHCNLVSGRTHSPTRGLSNLPVTLSSFPSRFRDSVQARTTQTPRRSSGLTDLVVFSHPLHSSLSTRSPVRPIPVPPPKTILQSKIVTSHDSFPLDIDTETHLTTFSSCLIVEIDGEELTDDTRSVSNNDYVKRTSRPEVS